METPNTLPTDILSQEHRVIEQVLACLAQMVRRIESSGELNLDHARDAVAFFRAFADQCHHGKEEVHLFPAMEARGIPAEGGPTGVMRYEHDEGRAHVRAMSDAIQAAAAGAPEAVRTFAAHAAAYIRLLTEHIQKEDHCLFPMANRAMSPEDQQALLDRFDHVEHEEMGAGTHEKYLGIANALAEAYQVPQAAAHAHAGHGCCHHKH